MFSYKGKKYTEYEYVSQAALLELIRKGKMALFDRRFPGNDSTASTGVITGYVDGYLRTANSCTGIHLDSFNEQCDPRLYVEVDNLAIDFETMFKEGVPFRVVSCGGEKDTFLTGRVISLHREGSAVHVKVDHPSCINGSLFHPQPDGTWTTTNSRRRLEVDRFKEVKSKGFSAADLLTAFHDDHIPMEAIRLMRESLEPAGPVTDLMKVSDEFVKATIDGRIIQFKQRSSGRWTTYGTHALELVVVSKNKDIYKEVASKMKAVTEVSHYVVQVQTDDYKEFLRYSGARKSDHDGISRSKPFVRRVLAAVPRPVKPSAGLLTLAPVGGRPLYDHQI